MPRPKLVWNNMEEPVRSERYIQLKTVSLSFVKDIEIEVDTPVAKFTAVVSDLFAIRPSRRYFTIDNRFHGSSICHPEFGLYGTMVYNVGGTRDRKLIHSVTLEEVKLAEYAYCEGMVSTVLLMNQFYSSLRINSGIDVVPPKNSPEALFAELEDRVMRTAKQYSI